MVLGLEGDGFLWVVIESVDMVVMILMFGGVDLFNVVLVVVVVFWVLKS